MRLVVKLFYIKSTTMKIQILLITLILFSCGSTKNTSDKIAKIQEDIETLLPKVQTKMDNLIQLRNGINLQGRALTTEEIQTVAKVDSLDQLFEQWKKDYEQRKVIRFTDENAHLNYFKQLKKNLEIIDSKCDETL